MGHNQDATIWPGKGHGRAPHKGVRKVRAPQGRMPANGWAVSELVSQGLSVKPMDSATESKPPD
jgi:hypothetical protein